MKKNITDAEILAAMPGTQIQLRQALGVAQASISRWTRRLRQSNSIHIGGWVEMANRPGLPQAIYHAGPGVDAPGPVISLAEARRRAPVALVVPLARPKMTAKRCDLTAALYGVA